MGLGTFLLVVAAYTYFRYHKYANFKIKTGAHYQTRDGRVLQVVGEELIGNNRIFKTSTGARYNQDGSLVGDHFLESPHRFTKRVVVFGTQHAIP